MVLVSEDGSDDGPGGSEMVLTIWGDSGNSSDDGSNDNSGYGSDNCEMFVCENEFGRWLARWLAAHANWQEIQSTKERPETKFEWLPLEDQLARHHCGRPIGDGVQIVAHSDAGHVAALQSVALQSVSIQNVAIQSAGQTV